MTSADVKISEDDVITKLKDDGHFDRLRLKIIRLLKQNENLRSNITSAVKESAVFTRAGAENMTPRQLCDAIHDEISENVMNQISDGLWEIIRSGDGMKSEITETVQSVYDKLLNSQGENTHGETKGESLSTPVQMPVSNGTELNGSFVVTGDGSGTLSDGKHKEPPGFSLQNQNGRNHVDSQSEIQQPVPSDGRYRGRRRESRWSSDPPPSDYHSSPPSGSLSQVMHKHTSDGNEEDPDIPPGFG